MPGLEDRPLACCRAASCAGCCSPTRSIPEPELLILDEPAAGLDDAALVILNEILLALKRGGRTTVLMVSHDLEQVRAWWIR